MNVDIQFDGTELSKSAKYALIISDLDFDELRSILIKFDVSIDDIGILLKAMENKQKGRVFYEN